MRGPRVGSVLGVREPRELAMIGRFRRNKGSVFIAVVSTSTVVSAMMCVALIMLRLQDIGSGSLNVPADDRRRSCKGTNPPVAVTSFRGSSAPVAILYDGKPDETGHLRRLGDRNTMGALYGLAYDGRRNVLYGAAHYRFFSVLSRDGAGAIYRFDIGSGRYMLLHNGDAGALPSDNNDLEFAERWAGRMGLGDIDYSEATDTLLVANLYWGVVQAISPDSGEVLRAYKPVTQEMSSLVRPQVLGLATRGEDAYVGVFDAADNVDPGLGYIVRISLSTGQMSLAAIIDFAQLSDTRWRGWESRRPAGRIPELNRVPQPMISDIAFLNESTMVVGLRNRAVDMTAGYVIGVYGDLLILDKRGSIFEVRPGREFFRDDLPGVAEPSFGGIGLFPGGRYLVTPAMHPFRADGDGGLIWMSTESGRISGPEDGREQLTQVEDEGFGDVEVLCSHEFPSGFPSHTPSATLTRTPSPQPTASVQPPSPTLSPTLSPTPLPTTQPSSTAAPRATNTLVPVSTSTLQYYQSYLPVTSKDGCLKLRGSMILVVDVSTSMMQPIQAGQTERKIDIAVDALVATIRSVLQTEAIEIAVIAFNERAWVQQAPTTDAAAITRSIAALSEHIAEYTRVDRALELANDLAGAHPFERPHVILITDGSPNGRDVGAESVADGAQHAATVAKERGTRVSVIGLGVLDAWTRSFLGNIASSMDQVAYALEAAEIRHQIERLVGGRACH